MSTIKRKKVKPPELLRITERQSRVFKFCTVLSYGDHPVILRIVVDILAVLPMFCSRVTTSCIDISESSQYNQFIQLVFSSLPML